VRDLVRKRAADLGSIVGGMSALHTAADGDHAEVIRALTEDASYRAPTESTDARGFTPAFLAVRANASASLRALSAAGANCEAEIAGSTPLHEAAQLGYWRCLDAICMEGGANINALISNGLTPLHL